MSSPLSVPLPISLALLLSAGEVSIEGLKALEFLLLASDRKDIVPVSMIAQYSSETKSNGFVRVSKTPLARLTYFSPGTFSYLGHTDLSVACLGAVATFTTTG